jgi:endonuclease-3 related protein
MPLNQTYQTLLSHYGPRHWWPADSPFEVVVGAVLTQNTNWNNVEKAIANLRREQALSAPRILQLPVPELEGLIRPSGYFRQKAARLQLFCRHLEQQHGGDLNAWLAGDLDQVREELLSLKGIGPETADSILLYAGQRPSFVVDAYTRRLFGRLGVLHGRESYDEIRTWFMESLEGDVKLYNEYHALIVIHAKETCRKKPLCRTCPCCAACRYGLDLLRQLG